MDAERLVERFEELCREMGGEPDRYVDRVGAFCLFDSPRRGVVRIEMRDDGVEVGAVVATKGEIRRVRQHLGKVDVLLHDSLMVSAGGDGRTVLFALGDVGFMSLLCDKGECWLSIDFKRGGKKR